MKIADEILKVIKLQTDQIIGEICGSYKDITGVIPEIEQDTLQEILKLKVKLPEKKDNRLFDSKGKANKNGTTSYMNGYNQALEDVSKLNKGGLK